MLLAAEARGERSVRDGWSFGLNFSLTDSIVSFEALADLHTLIVIQHKRPRSLRLLQDTDVEDESPLWVLQSHRNQACTR